MPFDQRGECPVIESKTDRLDGPNSPRQFARTAHRVTGSWPVSCECR